MKNSRIAKPIALVAMALLVSMSVGAKASLAYETGSQPLRFQQPGQASRGSRASQGNAKFRSPNASRSSVKRQPRKKSPEVVRVAHSEPVAKAAPRKKVVVKRRVKVVKRKPAPRRDRQVVVVADEQAAVEAEELMPIEPEPEPEIAVDMPMLYDDSPVCLGDGACGVYHDMGDPSCAFEDPGCGFAEPGCGFTEPGCGFGEPTCGSCVGRGGSDYWCFPVCLPRFKDLSFWGGVQGFRGPRDFAPGPMGEARSDSNFGFREGINISGRAPLVSLLFPQLSYQLGYQGVQSRLSGTTTSASERTQHFVTGGLFRRVESGLQFGVVWDMLRDDLDAEVDYHQIRTEISLKSPRGREFGFMSTTATNDNTVLGIVYETVDQYALFYRWNFGKSYEFRLWGGATDNSEGIFGGEFQAPLSDRWSVQSNFNYLITDQNAGLQGVREEAWNIGISLVWHMGRTARRGCRSPYRPLFAVADNGWMIVDNVTPYP